MSLPVARRIRPDEYLAFERLADTKQEYVAGVVYPWGDPDHPLDPDVVLGLRPEGRKSMAGGTEIHSSIKMNLAIGLGVLPANRTCRLYDGDLHFRPDEESCFYPDPSGQYSLPRGGGASPGREGVACLRIWPG